MCALFGIFSLTQDSPRFPKPRSHSQLLPEAVRRAVFDFYKSLSLYREHLVGDGTTVVLSPDSELFRYFDSDGVPAITGHSKDTADRG